MKTIEYPTQPHDVLRVHLKLVNMRQRELAEKMHVHPTTINKIVLGERQPSITTFAQISDILGPVFALEYLHAYNGHRLDARSAQL